MSDPDSIHVIVRGCGERTEALCRVLIERQLPAEGTLSVVSATPFDKTLRLCYEGAIARAARWTITVDADVLFTSVAIEQLVRRAEEMPPHFLQLEGRAFDKIQGRWREVGHRIYRTALLRKALAELPPAGTSLRPESATIKALGRQGHPSRAVDDTIGLHDFEQNYRDLYRKAFTHAHKHRSRIGKIITRCSDRQQTDIDYKVILKGIWDGLLYSGPVHLDAFAFRSMAQAALAEIGVTEKPPLRVDARRAPGDIDALMRQIRQEAPPTLEAPKDEPPMELSATERLLRGYRYRLRKRGLIGGNFGAVGAILRAIGDGLDR